MSSKRLFFAIRAILGWVYIAGGHDENKNVLESEWVYDLRKDEWAKLSRMSQEWDKCEGVVVFSFLLWIGGGGFVLNWCSFFFFLFFRGFFLLF